MFKALFHERRRTLAIRGLTLPDSADEPAFGRFVNAAASAFVAPLAALSLIHGNQQMIKASQGYPIGCMPRGDGFCSFVLDRADVLECCDLEGDPRFAMLPPVVGDPYVRYYIGAPLTLLNGIDVGVLCVGDIVRRQPASADQKAYLRGLARQASLMLEHRQDLLRVAA